MEVQFLGPHRYRHTHLCVNLLYLVPALTQKPETYTHTQNITYTYGNTHRITNPVLHSLSLWSVLCPADISADI